MTSRFNALRLTWTLALSACMAHMAQGLLDALNEEVEDPTLPVTATFKDTRIVNVQSNETPGAGVLHFVIAHRFGTLSSGAYDLWGLDNAQMRMAFDYGISDRLSVGVARNTYQKTYEANVKARVVRQTTGPQAFPLSVTWYSVAMANGLRVPDEALPHPFSRRLSYVHQAVVARKMSDAWSLALVPSFVHRNVVLDKRRPPRPVALGHRRTLQTRTPFQPQWGIPPLPDQSFDDTFSPACPSAWTSKPAGTFFNCTSPMPGGMFERSFLAEPAGSWANGDVYFGFNLSRVFTVKS